MATRVCSKLMLLPTHGVCLAQGGQLCITHMTLAHRACGFSPSTAGDLCKVIISYWITGFSAVRQCKFRNSWGKNQALKLNMNSGFLNVSVFPLIRGHLYAAYFSLMKMLRKSLSTSAGTFGLEFGPEAPAEAWTLTSIRAEVSIDWQCS